MLPAAGMTVVAVEQAVAAPFASRQLADLGARVIKIERPGTGDFARRYDAVVNGECSQFIWLNHSKESLTLDLKHPQGVDVLRRLLARADVFVHNLAPGAMERLGFGADALRAAWPRLVSCGITGYGADGPYRDRKAYDLLVQSEAGLLSITGTPDTPSRVGVSIADISAGMYAFSSILGALLRRERTGAGAVLEVSLFDSLAEWMGFPALYAAYTGAAPPRSGARNPVIAPYGPFSTGDGTAVLLGVQNDREWVRFCAEVLEAPALTDDPRFRTNVDRVRHRDALDALIAGVFARLTTTAAVARLDAAGIANARLNSVTAFLDHPQLTARGRWRTVDTPAGPVRVLAPPFAIDDEPIALGPVPAVGEHTTAILAEIGIAPATIDGWRAAGIV